MFQLLFVTQILLIVGKVAEYLPVSWWLIMLPTILVACAVMAYLSSVAYLLNKLYGRP